MLKTLLTLVVVVAIALAVFSNVGDAQVTSAWGACGTVVAQDANGKAFCESLHAGAVLWSVVLYASAFIAGLAGAALYLLTRGTR
jgi:hypothetical protein